MDMENETSSTFNINLLTGDVTKTILTQEGVDSSLSVTQHSTDMLPPTTTDVPSSSKQVTKVKPPSKVKVKETLGKNSAEYVLRRRRNNVAVKKSREKTREKIASTLEKVEQLKVENEELESKISILTKELSVLKDLFMEHAKGFCNGSNISLLSAKQLEALLGCKVNSDEHSKACSRNIPPSIEPLIDAAETELKTLKENEESQRCSGADDNSNEVIVTSVVTENVISIKEGGL